MKRLRIFAGPNGSGKSTIKQVVEDAGVHLGVYINADDYKKEINRLHAFDWTKIGLQCDVNHFMAAYKEAGNLYTLSEGDKLSSLLSFNKNGFTISEDCEVNDYFTSFLADYIRYRLLEKGVKFTFETVMSHPSKLDFITQAQNQGYRIYLYFVSLIDPALNVERVRVRVQNGGHDVPVNKINERYERTMNLLWDAICIADKTYIFDNSYSEPKWFATVINGGLELKKDVEYIPAWFHTFVLEKIK